MLLAGVPSGSEGMGADIIFRQKLIAFGGFIKKRSFTACNKEMRFI